MSSQERIIELQRQIKIAKEAISKIKNGCRDPEGVAADAEEKIWPLDRKQPLQGLVGHQRRAK